MAYAWMPEARRIRAAGDGGPLGGGAPRAVWLALVSDAGAVSVQSAAQRLIGERRPCHVIWDPMSGEVAQLISVLRAGCALGAPDRLDWAPGRIRIHPEDVNTEGRVCVQIGVLAPLGEPFTSGPLMGIEAIVSWLDSWGIPRRWPSGPPGPPPGYCAGAPARRGRSRALWARGGHFGASQVPGCENAGPGTIDIDRITGPHGISMRAREARGLAAALVPAALPIPA